MENEEITISGIRPNSMIGVWIYIPGLVMSSFPPNLTWEKFRDLKDLKNLECICSRKVTKEPILKIKIPRGYRSSYRIFYKVLVRNVKYHNIDISAVFRDGSGEVIPKKEIPLKYTTDESYHREYEYQRDIRSIAAKNEKFEIQNRVREFIGIVEDLDFGD